MKEHWWQKPSNEVSSSVERACLRRPLRRILLHNPPPSSSSLRRSRGRQARVGGFTLVEAGATGTVALRKRLPLAWTMDEW